MSDLGQPINEQSILKRRRVWRRWMHLFLVLAVVGGELFARFYLGLGDPPLMQLDPQIEYLFQPSHTYRRFGNHIHYNQWSMRSPELEKQKASPDEFRVLIVGDSVVNGGSLTDDSQLATTLLQRDLSEKLKRKVVVGNVSAGSWGPANQLSYLQRFGLFDADGVVFVWSSHDVYDVPLFDPRLTHAPDFPTSTPICALWEGFTRYFVPRLWFLRPEEPPPEVPATQPVPSCIDAMKTSIEMAKAMGAGVIVARHYTVEELGKPEGWAHAAIREVAQEEGVPLISFDAAFQTGIKQGLPIYRDIIHPGPAGQRVIADVLEPAIEESLHAAKPAGT